MCFQSFFWIIGSANFEIISTSPYDIYKTIFSFHFFSTFFLAHLGEQELIAGTISLWVYSVILIVIWGTMCSVSIMVARSYGADDKESVGKILYDSIILALLFSLIGFVAVWNMSALLAILGQPSSIVILSKAYFHALAWGLLPDFIGFVLIQFLIGIGHTKTNLIFKSIVMSPA